MRRRKSCRKLCPPRIWSDKLRWTTGSLPLGLGVLQILIIVNCPATLWLSHGDVRVSFAEAGEIHAKDCPAHIILVKAKTLAEF